MMLACATNLRAISRCCSLRLVGLAAAAPVSLPAASAPALSASLCSGSTCAFRLRGAIGESLIYRLFCQRARGGGIRGRSGYVFEFAVFLVQQEAAKAPKPRWLFRLGVAVVYVLFSSAAVHHPEPTVSHLLWHQQQQHTQCRRIRRLGLTCRTRCGTGCSKCLPTQLAWCKATSTTWRRWQQRRPTLPAPTAQQRPTSSMCRS